MPAAPRLPGEENEAPHSRLAIPNRLTAIAAALWLGIILFLPPGVTYFRNPPPPDLVPTWWVRFDACLGLLAFDVLALYLPWIRRPEIRLGVRTVHLVTAGWAILIAVLLFINWVYPYPYPFGLPVDFFKQT